MFKYLAESRLRKWDKNKPNPLEFDPRRFGVMLHLFIASIIIVIPIIIAFKTFTYAHICILIVII